MQDLRFTGLTELEIKGFIKVLDILGEGFRVQGVALAV